MRSVKLRRRPKAKQTRLSAVMQKMRVVSINQQSILGYFKEIRPDHNELVPALKNYAIRTVQFMLKQMQQLEGWWLEQLG
jgi:hypothetical protein